MFYTSLYNFYCSYIYILSINMLSAVTLIELIHSYSLGFPASSDLIISGLTQSNDAQRFPSNTRSASGHLPDLLHAGGTGALTQSLMHPGDAAIQIQN